MAGWLDNGMPILATFTGNELMPMDQANSGGSAPQSGSLSVAQLAPLLAFYSNFASKTTVSGTIYYGTYVIGSASPTSGVVTPSATRLIDGINVLVGATGGTDLWIAGMYNSAGILVANSTTSGTTAGTAGTWQQLAFSTAYAAAPGVYLLALQSNGTTATPACYNWPAPSPASSAPILSGSQTGSFATLATISSVATTYTANRAPVMFPYT